MRVTTLEAWIAEKIGLADLPMWQENLEAYQLERLRQVVEMARRCSPFYRQHLRGVQIAQLQSREDVCQLPFVNAGHLMYLPQRLLCQHPGKISRVVSLSSSGTTGPCKRLYFTRADQELTLDFFHRGMETLAGPGDRALLLFPGRRPDGLNDLLARALGRLAVKAYLPPGADPAQVLDFIAREKVNLLIGSPVAVLTLARWRSKMAPDTVRKVLLSADYVPQVLVQAVESAWDCEVFEHYGMTEMGLGGGVECAAHRGYHFREADLLLEIIDPDSGRPVADGQPGELVFTTLTREGMPLIRYRSGDITRFLKEPCPCGSTLQRVDKVKGRLGAEADLGWGKLFLQELDEKLFSLEGVVNFSAGLHQRDDKVRLCLEVETTQRVELSSRQVLDILVGIPVIGQGLDRGGLEVELQFSSLKAAPWLYAGKRTLDDLRNTRVPETKPNGKGVEKHATNFEPQ